MYIFFVFKKHFLSIFRLPVHMQCMQEQQDTRGKTGKMKKKCMRKKNNNKENGLSPCYGEE